MTKTQNHFLSHKKQFLLATKMTNHPNFSIPYTVPDRLMKHDLQSKFEDDIPAELRSSFVWLSEETAEDDCDCDSQFRK